MTLENTDNTECEEEIFTMNTVLFGTVFLLTCDSVKATCRALICKLRRRDSAESSL